jgi:hypothetical protein
VTRAVSHARRGAILLEIVLSLGLFLATSMTLFIVVSGAVGSLRRSRAELIASDHARNALAMIEAGIARPETLNGPVAPWSGGDEFGEEFGDAGFAVGMDDAPFMPSGPAGAEPFDAGFSGGIGDGPAGGLLGVGDTGWSLEIETEPAEVRGLTLVIVRAYETDEAGGEAEGGASFTLRQIVALEGGGSDDPFGDDPFAGGFDGGRP